LANAAGIEKFVPAANGVSLSAVATVAAATARRGAMAASAYHLLCKLPPAPASLSVTLRTIVLAAGHVAAGDSSAVIAAFRCLPETALRPAYSLAVLQSAAFVGFPRALTGAPPADC
jgi:hypothetical protein